MSHRTVPTTGDRTAAYAQVKARLLVRFGTDQFVGESPAFLASLEKLVAYSQSLAPVLITGETGTGKESVARAVHYLGARADKPFIPVNCGSLPDALLENELFGHERGAYTDASRAHTGLVREAHGGTLFLDEINTLSASGQVKLLRFLEDRRYKPLGASKYVDADVRFIAATNCRLRDEVAQGRFRQDLFYRINLLNVELPPLRERGTDVSTIARHYLKMFSAMYGKPGLFFSAETFDALQSYPWPGNIRELKNMVEKGVLDAKTEEIIPYDLDIALPEEADTPAPTSFREAKKAVVREFEREYLLRILNEHDGNISRAARSAGTDRRSFQRLMKLHHINGPAATEE